MYTAPTSSESSDTSRMTVADILSSMATATGTEAMTPTTLFLLDGLSGVPTRTTPTLTPTTLRNIEQTFLDLAAATSHVPHQHEAGFVPPLVGSPQSSMYSVPQVVITAPESIVSSAPSSISSASQAMSLKIERWNSGRTSQASMSSELSLTRSTKTMSSTSSRSSSASMSPPLPTPKRGGGRKPNKDQYELEETYGPEEAERRKIRRERNKMAAARCRKRRLDHTNLLQEETDNLEEKQRGMQQEIQLLQRKKEELEFLLEAHKAHCKLRRNDASKAIANVHIKKEIDDNQAFIPPMAKQAKLSSYQKENFNHPSTKSARPRPTSLPVSSHFVPSSPKTTTSGVTEIAGVSITTPSTGLGFNFDSLMEGGTGLTPVASSVQLVAPSPSPSYNTTKNPVADLASPESLPPKLVSL